MSTREEMQLMLRAAQLYFYDNLTQQQVAKELGSSRPTISRLLRLAKQEGIVQITVVDPFVTMEEVEDRLVEAFDLKQAIVVAGEGLSVDLLRRRLGFATAEYIQRTIDDGSLVGIGWGRTLQSVVEALDTEHQSAIQVFPLIGGLGQISPSLQVNDLARGLAEPFGGTWQPFYVPAFVDDRAALKGLLHLTDVESVIQTWPNLDVALVGIGRFARQIQSSMLFASYVTDDELQELEQCSAVGDICGRFFDIHGEQCLLMSEIIGISLEQLKALGNVIGVAGGEQKASAILGALRGGYLNVLVTDTVTAAAILEKHEIE